MITIDDMESNNTPSSEPPFWPPQPPKPAAPAPDVNVVASATPPPYESATAEPSGNNSSSAGDTAKGDDFREKMKPVVDGAKKAAIGAGKMAQTGARRIWPVIQPILHRAWLNVRVWVPQIANPELRSRTVTFDADENLADGLWVIELPPQCWKTGRKEGLESRAAELELRSGENPQAIPAGTIGAIVLFFLIWWFEFSTFGTAFILSLMAALVGFVVWRVKSWPERVRVKYFVVSEEAETPILIEGVAFDQKLHLILPDARLADATRMSIAAERKARVSARMPSAGSPAADGPIPPPSGYGPSSNSGTSAPPSHPSAPVVHGYKRSELPPIKLDD